MLPRSETECASRARVGAALADRGERAHHLIRRAPGHVEQDPEYVAAGDLGEFGVLAQERSDLFIHA